MFRSVLQHLPRLVKSLPGLLVALVFVAVTQPALALEGDTLLAHRLKLNLPSLLPESAAAEVPRVTVELGYGRALPPFLGVTAPTALPDEFGSPARQSAIKANITLGF
jgi:hypothetical protein